MVPLKIWIFIVKVKKLLLWKQPLHLFTPRFSDVKCTKFFIYCEKDHIKRKIYVKSVLYWLIRRKLGSVGLEQQKKLLASSVMAIMNIILFIKSRFLKNLYISSIFLFLPRVKFMDFTLWRNIWLRTKNVLPWDEYHPGVSNDANELCSTNSFNTHLILSFKHYSTGIMKI